MINCMEYTYFLDKLGINLYVGVPDSIIKHFLLYLSKHKNSRQYIVAANEGTAVSIAAGHYLATGMISMVYMQNSGLGNALDPLTSLVNKEVYGIPMLLLIGWRGMANEEDEPQHIKMGKTTLPLLEALKINYEIHPYNLLESRPVIERAVDYVLTRQTQYALVVRPGTYEAYIFSYKDSHRNQITREEAIREIILNLKESEIVVATTGKTSRELFEQRETIGHPHDTDFLNIGAMGHASSIALGIAIAKPERRVYCLDGDGSFLMHMGAAAAIGTLKPRNYTHIVVNNRSHDSTGGQPTAGQHIDIPVVAKACGYSSSVSVERTKDIADAMRNAKDVVGPALIEILARPNSGLDLKRPSGIPKERKVRFMANLEVRND